MRESIISDDSGHVFEINPASPLFVLLESVKTTLFKYFGHGETEVADVILNHVRVLLVKVVQVR